MSLRIDPLVTEIRRSVLRLEGLANAVGRVALRPDVATTVVSDLRISPFSTITLTPMSASAAVGGYWIEIGKGTFTIHHSASATEDRLFGWAVNG